MKTPLQDADFANGGGVLFSQHPLPMWLFEISSLRFLEVNDAAVRAYGYTREQFLGMTLREIRRPEQLPALTKTSMDPVSARTRARHLKADGAEIDVEVYARRVNYQGRPAMLITALDLTEMVGAQSQARRSEDLLRTVTEELPDAVYVKDLDGRYVFVNSPGAAFAGRPRDDFAGRTDEEMFGSETGAIFRQHDLAALRGSGPVASEEHVTLHGRAMVFQAIKAPWRDAQGEVRGIIGISRDVTAQRAAEAHLYEIEERYRLAFEYAPIGMALAGVDGRWLYANRAMCNLTGYSPDELARMSFGELTHPEDREHTAGQAADLLAGHVAFAEAVKRYVRKDGSPVWVRRTASLLRDETRQPLYFIVQVQDITRLHEAEQAVRASEERFRVLVENASELVFVLDEHAHFVFASDSFAKVLGYAAAELIGGDGMRLVHAEDLEVAKGVLARALRAPDELVPCEVRALHRSGEVRVMECLVRSMVSHPAIRGIVINARDITDRRLAEQALQQRMEELRQAQKMEAVGRLAGGIAHDFNNVLTAISGHAEFLAEMFSASDPVHVDIEAIRTAADRAARLTAQLLAFSRRQMMLVEVIDLRTVLNDMQVMLQRLIGEDVDLRCLPGDEVMPVHADRTQIEQVILNLALNGRDAMPQGGALTISLWSIDSSDIPTQARADVAEGQYIMLRVQDNGEGIAPELLDKIFEPFFTTKERGRGTGLGLSTAYGIVKQSRGYVLVDSAPNQGTCFDVLLPRDASIASAATVHVRESRAAPGAETVLLVEDEASVRNMAERVLQRQGYSVLTATNGSEALSVMQSLSGAVDIVVTDVVMPEMSGPELATQLAQRYPQTAILFMSGYTDNEINEDGIKAAEAAFLPKPFTPQELAQQVRAVLGKQSL